MTAEQGTDNIAENAGQGSAVTSHPLVNDREFEHVFNMTSHPRPL